MWKRKNEKSTYFNYQEVLKNKNYSWNRGEARSLTVLFNTGETKDDEVEEPRPHVESPLPFASLLLYRKIVPKRTSKRPQSLEDGHWGRCRTQTTALTVCHFVFPNFLVWKWSEERKVVGSKQTLSASLRFDKIFLQPRKWTGTFLSCCKHFYKVSFWRTQKNMHKIFI